MLQSGNCQGARLLRKVKASRNPVSTHHPDGSPSCGGSDVGIILASQVRHADSEPKPHEINKLPVSFDCEVRKRGRGTVMRIPGHACIDHRSAEPGMGKRAVLIVRPTIALKSR